MKMELDRSKGGSRAVDIRTGGNIRSQLMDISPEIKVMLASKAWSNIALSENAIQHLQVVLIFHHSALSFLPEPRDKPLEWVLRSKGKPDMPRESWFPVGGNSAVNVQDVD